MGQINRGNSASRSSDDALDTGIELESHPLYQQALSYLQRGEWQEAIARLAQLSDQHPESHQVKALLDEARLKASLDKGARVEAKRPSLLSNRWIRILLLSDLILIVISLVLYFGRDKLLAYQRQWQLYVENKRRQTVVARLLQEGQRHLAAGDYENAARNFEELLALSPDHRKAQEGLSEAREMMAVASLYEQAMDMVKGERWEEALEHLEQIAQIEPSYKDVARQIAFVRRRIKVAGLFREAEGLYQASDWQGAAAKYEEVRRLDLDYRRQVVEDRLFDCYLNWGMELVEAGGSVESVREALALFEKALALRPLEACAGAERRLAKAYLEAMDMVKGERWEEALEHLEQIAQIEPSYKDVARQIAFVRRRIKVAGLFREAEGLYQASDWQGAAAKYEEVRRLDLDYRRQVVEDRLFDCYLNWGMELVEAGGSVESVREALALFEKALALRPLEACAGAERRLARLYVEGYDLYQQGCWEEAVVKLEKAYRERPSYAGGQLARLLHEAYIKNGAAYAEEGAFELAQEQYRKALEIGGDEEDGVTQLLCEAYIKGGDACLKAGSYELACEQYRQALRLKGYGNEEAGAIARAYVSDGDAYVEAADYRLAAEQYRRALEVLEGEEIVHFVQPGEYLVLIASRYNTTVEAIVAANDISNPSLILAGQRLVIPVTPESAKE